MMSGRLVLHASAVQVGASVVAFSGPSGAGKSTVATLLGDAVALDLLPVEGDRALVDGEAAIDRWVAESAPLLERGPVPARELVATAAASRTAPLREIVYLDAARRAGTEIARAPLTHTGSALRLLENGFGELPDPGVWRDLVAGARALAASVRAFDATVPDGIDPLRAALARYRTSSAS
jgi:hypothetical protein